MPRHYDYTVTEDEAGIRLDRFVAGKRDDLSRSFVQKLISQGTITIGSMRVKSSYNVRAGDRVSVILPDPQPSHGPCAQDIPLDIQFQDHHIIVVNKPAGMVVHPAAGVSSGTLVNAVLSHISPDLTSIAPQRPGIVHRLDRGTSGLLVVARTARAYYSLATQFKEHTVTRKYIALVCGAPRQDNGIIAAPIGRSRRDKRKMTVTSAGSREAITHFSVAERYRRFSLLEIKPRTGRTHQIRVHLSHIGYPVVGDPTYGGRSRALRSATSKSVIAALQNLSRQALHAQLLGFTHPHTDRYIEFSAPIPGDIQAVIDALRSAESQSAL